MDCINTHLANSVQHQVLLQRYFTVCEKNSQLVHVVFNFDGRLNVLMVGRMANSHQQIYSN